MGILSGGGYLVYGALYTDNLEYRVPIIPSLSFSLQTQNLKRWKRTHKQTKRETEEFCTDIGDKYLYTATSLQDHSSQVGGVVDLAGV